MEDLFCGFILGIVLVGSITYRNIFVYDGKIPNAVITSGIVSITYWFGIKFVVTNNIIGYLGFAIGELLIVGIMSYKQRITKDANKNNFK